MTEHTFDRVPCYAPRTSTTYKGVFSFSPRPSMLTTLTRSLHTLAPTLASLKRLVFRRTVFASRYPRQALPSMRAQSFSKRGSAPWELHSFRSPRPSLLAKRNVSRSALTTTVSNSFFRQSKPRQMNRWAGRASSFHLNGFTVTCART